ncbi:keratin, type I cytoskeletal 9-like [Panicum hallii]|uniref:keratin, type I cytoskeletal 9-like n=1 Tax=Panicum hallii TaxID=206008 RepID=UPI000DF4ED93|nr:keratin, type I cytoskeletal 9-like [Panicum hallii]
MGSAELHDCSPCNNLRILRRLSSRELQPPAGFFHHRWGAGGNGGSTTIPAHGRGGSGRSFGGRGHTPDRGDPSSRSGRRDYRGGCLGIHEGGTLRRAGCGGGYNDSGGRHSGGHRGSQLRPLARAGGCAGGGVREAPSPKPGGGPSSPPPGQGPAGLEEAEVGFRQEWEKLEAERLWLFD